MNLTISKDWTAAERLPLIAELASQAQTANSFTLKTQLEETIFILASWDSARLEAHREWIEKEVA